MVTCHQQVQWIQLRARNCVSLPAQCVCDICELHSVCAICLCVCDSVRRKSWVFYDFWMKK